MSSAEPYRREAVPTGVHLASVVAALVFMFRPDANAYLRFTESTTQDTSPRWRGRPRRAGR
ncbi:hypothetical protein HDA32_001334 [Spinactinospora alkalitolerans]|uniref:Uncharacterized protein n=1 Tax=Spinactinospora alkalitolerans TaxID=687207 RepID=A0A852TVW7_9ACTN|nr:hypothetical protein [Spinactinospora alkalitolerans]